MPLLLTLSSRHLPAYQMAGKFDHADKALDAAAAPQLYPGTRAELCLLDPPFVRDGEFLSWAADIFDILCHLTSDYRSNYRFHIWTAGEALSAPLKAASFSTSSWAADIFEILCHLT